MGKWHRMGVALLAIVYVFLAVTQNAKAETPQPLIISAASSLTNVMHSLGKDFETRSPGVKIIFNFGSTGDLLAQMSQGAPVDIFASASVMHMDQALKKGLVAAATRKTFARNVLVLAKPAASAMALTGLSDLTSPQVERIGIGKPETVPAGQYAKEVLVAAGVWSAVEDKLIFASSVRQVLDYLRRGEVDAALIYATDAKVAKKQVAVVSELPGSPILYPVALAKTTHDRKKATLFLDYLATDAARDILMDHGFLLP